MTLRISALAALLIVVLPLLSACATADGTEAPKPAPTFGCPRGGLMRDADRLAVFEDMANPSRETVTVKAQLYGMNYACKPVPKRGEIEVAVTTRFVADRMPLGGSLKGLTLPYFVAVLDQNENILVHERFDVRLTFGEGSKNLPPTRAIAQEERMIAIAAPDAGGSPREGVELVFRRAWRSRHTSEIIVPATTATTGTGRPSTWCTQCDRKVSLPEAERCASPFCKAKAIAA